jgi:sulfatase maturation enzyme AslB (radical SAM superfamily)
MLLILATDSLKDGDVEYLKSSNLLARLAKICPNIVLVGPEELAWTGLKVFSTLDRAADYAVRLSIGKLLLVDGLQIFIDTEIVQNGLDQWSESSADYFTQWEHCRLPIGVGIRGIKTETCLRSKAKTTSELIDYICINRDRVAALYDPLPNNSFDQAQLDARLSPTIMKWINECDESVDWSLQGFLGLIKDGGKIKYEALHKSGACVDERGMLAPYGFETDECADFPTYVMFDMTNKCNAKCIHCPQSVGFPGSDQSIFLEKKSFMRIVDQCVGRKLDIIRITADGEPLLHPDIWDMLDYARRKIVGPIGLTTNGSTLNKENCRRMISSEISFVDISLDAFSQPTFELIRAGLSYERTKENVLNLIELRNEAQSQLKIMVSFVKQKENQHELEDFTDFWAPKVDQILVREMHNNVGFNDNSESGGYASNDRYPCPHLFRRTVINYDGVYKFCPIDWEGGSKYIPEIEENIFSAWHSDFYHLNRLEHLNNSFSENSICRTCDDWMGTPWNLGYEKVINKLLKDE